LKAWQGILVATHLPFHEDLSINFEAYGDHVNWLLANGCDGVTPNGSLGEYQTLSADERRRVVVTAVEASQGRGRVVPGVAAYGAREAQQLAAEAADIGAEAVLLLPPNSYRADETTVLAHFRQVAEVGIPIIAYNNPIDTKVDLTPEILARLFHEGLIVAVKEFSGDVRRSYEIREVAPGLDVLIGSDDVALEVGMAGATGWIGGYNNVFPNTCRELFDAAIAVDTKVAVPLFRSLHPLLRWDSKTEFVQAIKLSLEIVGRVGGKCRPPRSPLKPEQEAAVRLATEAAVAAGYH
jgi:4-hydroxy-tetrahydrodipicolinate synthase